MRALVLSGGGNRGALQVGALRALLEQSIVPDIIVGCSAGALNAAFMARDFSLAQTDHLLAVWQGTTKEDVYPGGRMQILWRVLSGKDSLYDNSNFYAFLQRAGIDPALTFGDLPGHIPLFITATHLKSETMHIFGDRPGDRVLDALMASTALPPVHPPWTVDGERYIDGGTVTPLPLRVAIEKGATEIYALHIWDDPKPAEQIQRGVSAIVNRSISTMLRLQAEHDLLLSEMAKKLRLHNIRLWTEAMPDINDWSQSNRLYEAGYRTASSYLATTSKRGQSADQPSPPIRRLARRLGHTWQNLTGSKSAGVSPVPASID
ncbi:MAG: patatin-like phospholipase family protein [Caldilineaceae bacterium]|nr:patatin-like phospholipase family protein [Caldilineaceae bacterium]